MIISLYAVIKPPPPQIFFRNRVRLTDEADLQDTKNSLCTLLDEFIKDVKPELPDNERRILSERMDMSAVRREFERYAPSTIWALLSGKLLRVILIQILVRLSCLLS